MRWALWALALSACVSPGSFHCTASADCHNGASAGTCEPSGFCSFPDPGCSSGRRFGARSLPADECVLGGDGDGGEGDGASDAGPGLDGARDGASDSALDASPAVDAAPVDAGPDASQACGLPGNACCPGASCGGGLRCTAPVAGVCTCLAAISSRIEHSCVQKTDGSLWCWGNNGYTQLAHASPPVVGTPVPAELPGAVSAVLAAGEGGTHTCVVDQNHLVWCVGGNFLGQCGDGATVGHFGDWVQPLTPPMPPALTPQVNLTGVTAIATGEDFNCALTSGGEVDCWGDDGNAQLGYPTAATPNDFSTYVGASMVTGASAVAAGGFHACAIMAADHSVRCWGANRALQLGGGGSSTADSLVPIAAGLTGVTRLALGFDHSCALTDQAEVWCWGTSLDGANGSFMDLSTPTRLTSLSAVSGLAAGDNYTCAVKTDGTVWCWGDNSDGELGQAPLPGGNFSRAPVQVPGISDAIDIAAGDAHTCVIRRDGTVACWGSNSNAAIGANPQSLPMSATPIPIRITCP